MECRVLWVPDQKVSQPLVGWGSFIHVLVCTRPFLILWSLHSVTLTCDPEVQGVLGVLWRGESSGALDALDQVLEEDRLGGGGE